MHSLEIVTANHGIIKEYMIKKLKYFVVTQIYIKRKS
jgi:hypothetical protein